MEVPLLTFVMIYVGAALAGGAVACLSRWLVLQIVRPVVLDAPAWNYAEQQRIALRKHASLFRWFEPLVETLRLALDRNAQLVPRSLRERLQLDLHRGGYPVPLDVELYLSFCLFQGLVGAVCGSLMCLIAGNIQLAAASLFLSPVLSIVCGARQVSRNAGLYVREVNRQLPFAIDILSLMMEAGASFPEALKAAVTDAVSGPARDELAIVQRMTESGRTLESALSELQRRIRDEQVDEIVLSVQQGLTSGTPLSKVLLNLADQMKLRRTQFMEKQAAQAQAMITFPAFIVTMACMIAIVGPFVVAAATQWPF